MVYLTLLIVGLSGMTPAEAGTRARSVQSPYLLSYAELMKLTKPKRHSYLRGIAKKLARIPERSKPKPGHYSILRLLWETAHASQFQCIGGGIFVGNGAEGCGLTEYAGFRCSGRHEGQDMCTPL
ncbi:MAG: hypothetical protein HRT45_19270, partial [Bdellovibrionales bacterium]|nr:hypothetical protein [Bdellovibrionales bacterium]